MSTNRVIHVSEKDKDIFDKEITLRIKNKYPFMTDKQLTQEFKFNYMVRYCLGNDYEQL